MHNASDQLEVEVKFHLNQPAEMHRRLQDLGAVSQPRIFETNLRFEDQGKSLKAGHQLLRLRQDTSCRLTFKQKPARSESQCKVYRELEVEVSDFDTMKGILMNLGYHQAQIYEKWRQVYRWNNVEICMDTLPYGDFIEIEGAEEDIAAAAAKLSLPWGARILANYLAMFEVMRTRNNLPFHDVTFSNFEGHPADIAPLITTFMAGTGSDTATKDQ